MFFNFVNFVVKEVEVWSYFRRLGAGVPIRRGR